MISENKQTPQQNSRNKASIPKVVAFLGAAEVFLFGMILFCDGKSNRQEKANKAVKELTQKTVVKTHSDMDKAFIAFREAVDEVTDGDMKSVQKLDSLIAANGIKTEVYGRADSTSVSYDANKHSIMVNYAYEKDRKENIVKVIKSVISDPKKSLSVNSAPLQAGYEAKENIEQVPFVYVPY